MTSKAYQRALSATGFMTAQGKAPPGLLRRGDSAAARLRPLLADERVGLKADAVFLAQNAPTTIFKDAGAAEPGADEVRRWHEAAWNVGLAPLLWIVTPTDVRLYDCYASPPRSGVEAQPLDSFALSSEERMQALDAVCGRLATETGAFWSNAIGSKINRRHRVDRELLGEINALETRLTDLGLGDNSRSPPQTDIAASRDFAQRLIGRCIFTWYLLDREVAQRFLPKGFPTDLSEMFSTPKRAFELFDWLRTTFNGDLFPMDDPGAERERLGVKHLELIRDFIEGRSLVPEQGGQGRLFRFRFDAIPVDLISAIYQQFARSSAADQAHVQGLHYTPVELVHLALDPVFEGLPASARVIDPTCGSGAFLVEAFRRLVWKTTEGKPASRRLVRRILYNQLFGVDVNRSALGIAAFSLYLAAMELDEEPVKDIKDLKFDRLINSTLFEADTIGEELPTQITKRPFDAVVGNPPWTFVSKKTGLPKRGHGDANTLRPRRSPDHQFLAVASRLAGDQGRIGMVMKATPFFSKDEHALGARLALLTNLSPLALINLSFLRKEELFPDATGPALLLFARCSLAPGKDQILLGSIPWTPDFRRTGVFHVGPGEIRALPLKRALKTPTMLKAGTFGTVRDGWLIEKLEREHADFGTVLDMLGCTDRGQGFQVKGDLNEPPSEYYTLKVVTPDVFTAFRLDKKALTKFVHPTLHRIRNPSIFRGPVLLCSKAGWTAAAERGRYSAAISEGGVLYTENFFGVSFSNGNSQIAHVVCGILNSSLTAFQFAFGGGTWGLERPTVEPRDLLSLRIPNLNECPREHLKAVANAEKRAAEDPSDGSRLKALDAAVFELYELEPDEQILVAESVMRARHLIFENRGIRKDAVRPPDTKDLRAYGKQVAQTVDAYLRARGERHLEAIVYPTRVSKGDPAAGVVGITAVRFVMGKGPAGDGPVVRDGDPSELNSLAALLRGRLEADIPPYLNERRQLRVYGSEDLFILKPTEARYWTRTAGLNDADIILSDHWLRRRNAAVS